MNDSDSRERSPFLFDLLATCALAKKKLLALRIFLKCREGNEGMILHARTHNDEDFVTLARRGAAAPLTIPVYDP